jgi:hypothetical protein
MGCLTTTDMVLREESNGSTLIISYSTRPSPEKKITCMYLHVGISMTIGLLYKNKIAF